jgi:hypothetical protein
MLQIEHIPLETLVPADYNPRRMADDQMASLMRSLREFGWVEPVVVNTRTGLIVGGHQRVEAAKRLLDATKGKGRDRWAKVPVVYVDLDAGKERALNVALNKISGEFDYPKLAELLQSLDVDDMALTGFTPDDLDAMLTSVLPPNEDEWAAGMAGVPTGERAPFQQKTFTLSDDQAALVDEALDVAANLGAFVDTGNENRNGNALNRICEMFLGANR